MQDVPMLFPMAPAEFWKQIKTTIEEVVNEKINQSFQPPPTTSHLPEKALLKASDICAIFQVSKPTLYDWLKQDKLRSFKIKSRRYFLRSDIEAMIRQETTAVSPKYDAQ
jgi:predicted DNA-binding transcriptional regulator AlpA